MTETLVRINEYSVSQWHYFMTTNFSKNLIAMFHGNTCVLYPLFVIPIVYFDGSNIIDHKHTVLLRLHSGHCMSKTLHLCCSLTLIMQFRRHFIRCVKIPFFYGTISTVNWKSSIKKRGVWRGIYLKGLDVVHVVAMYKIAKKNFLAWRSI